MSQDHVANRDHAVGRTVVVETADADATRALGVRLAALLRAGDLVMLSGALGAGKTTLAQGIGSAMDVRGRVSSPTFIIARVHPALGQGPDLVHVDAYRLSSLEEVDALDLDTSLAESVTLVEWGEDKVEALSESRLEIRVERLHGALTGTGAGTVAGGGEGEAALADLEEIDDGRRSVTVTALGPRWADVDLTVLTDLTALA
ncbi:MULTISPECIES: tRNA (adenosine(37)-N6)-threonylcarbamoyltransferase complex ATPase subunit type 1 TsaE [Actinomyces]|uniref:tRNA threonylcarbamoyladenosine biosynthesis protein TsaE n=1 Tax=Actinomyces respiraculi TaxID=2744574 RepID=A0A7T0LJT1_9ACTO|nr:MULTISPECIES: tRNA (adenosine(37)-N6)-threonylcarbamoyltransferase complex ATPase subunit type 1 TsaE [Actinomyces]QPL04947.1 tRNA (adenosine(37)-N6)-threonylcarbamoyltransferase complex ATPase subunit type 1 TsaE [Actinomyces respiraculi]